MLHGTFANRSHHGLLLIRMYYKYLNNGPDLVPDIDELVVNTSRDNVMLIHDVFTTVLF